MKIQRRVCLFHQVLRPAKEPNKDHTNFFRTRAHSPRPCNSSIKRNKKSPQYSPLFCVNKSTFCKLHKVQLSCTKNKERFDRVNGLGVCQIVIKIKKFKLSTHQTCLDLLNHFHLKNAQNEDISAIHVCWHLPEFGNMFLL